MLVLKGNEVAKARKELLKGRIAKFKEKHGFAPGLAVVLVGEDPASQVYVRNKDNACKAVGLNSFRHNLPADTTQEALNQLIDELNTDEKVHGILVQFPLPKGLSADQVLQRISPGKDADGLTYYNMGLHWAGRPQVVSCTPAGIMAILEHYEIPVTGKNAVVIGRSNLVGRPIAQLLQLANATVTTCHSKTANIREHTLAADIVVVAAGQPRHFGKEDFKKGAVVIDVGIHRLPPEEGQEKASLCGDVRFEELEGWAGAATPVPGGVGPMTITMLLENTVDLAELVR